MILVVDMNWKKDSLAFYEFVAPIVSSIEKFDEYNIRHYLELTSEDLHKCDKIILSGTALKDTATLEAPQKFEWLKKIDKPALGICAGMETIGIVFGERLINCLEIGITEVTRIKENPLFPNNFRAYSLHSLCMGLSENFEVWAESSRCPQVIKHRSKPIYGMLFHPEVRNPELIGRFVQLDNKPATS